MNAEVLIEEFEHLATDEILASLLDLEPVPIVVGVGDHGQFVALPEPLAGHFPDATGWSWLDLITDEDRNQVVDLWFQMHSEGRAAGTVHLTDDPGREVVLQFLRAEEPGAANLVIAHGVPLGAGQLRLEDPPPLRPRLTVARKDKLGMIIGVDPAFALLLGWAPEEVIGKRLLDFVHHDDQRRVLQAWMEMHAAPEHAHRFRLRHRTAAGAWLWVEITNHLLPEAEGGPLLTEMVDISEEMAAQEALRDRERLFHGLAESLPIGLIQVGLDGSIRYTNDRLPTILGVAAASTLEEQFLPVVEEDRPMLLDALRAVREGGPDSEAEVRLRTTGDTSLRWCRLTVRRLDDDEGAITGAIICVADVTDNARVRVELEHQATFDPLTGCHNRASVMLTLTAALDGRDDDSTVFFVDLDRFKVVNDIFGHAGGDELLVATAARLRELVRVQDTIGRIGGDEFLVVCPGLANETDALALAERVAARLAEPVKVAGELIEVQASVGVARSGVGRSAAADVVADADAAMYVSKRKGRGVPVLHRRSSGKVRPLRNTSAPALRRALTSGELAVHYQPVVDLASGTTLGFEALLRWSQGGRWVVAQEFIELAEVTGLIIEIGQWVVDQVSGQAGAARRELGKDLLWFVNVSSLELAVPGMAVSVTDTLERGDLPPASVVFEVTEHAGLAAGAIAHRTLVELEEVGVGIALDDFGTGWSSLALLRDLPVSWLKVDQSFISDLSAGNDRHLVGAVLDLGRRLHLRTVIEGVETEQQRQQLLELGAVTAQGHLFSAAEPLEHFLAGVHSSTA